MAIGDLELTIARTGAATTAALRVELPSRRVDLTDETPIALDEAALRAMSTQPTVYAAALTEMVFAPALRAAWERAAGYAAGSASALRVRLHLCGDDALHAIRWELLRDPLDQAPLAHSERTFLSRFLSSDYLGEIQAPAEPQLRALLAVSAAAGPGMAAVDVPGEVRRALAGLGAIDTTVLDGRAGRPAATMRAISDALRAEPHILCLVCHGALADGEPYLWLEPDDTGPARPVAGAELVQRIGGLLRRPLLIVLAVCESAGDEYAVLAAVGPQLARRGVGAVIGMAGPTRQDLIAGLLPGLFRELRRDGQIDRALAAARADLPADAAWWRPVLWLAVRDGRLWREEVPLFASAPGLYPPCPRLVGQAAIRASLAFTHLALISAAFNLDRALGGG